MNVFELSCFNINTSGVMDFEFVIRVVLVWRSVNSVMNLAESNGVKFIYAAHCHAQRSFRVLYRRRHKSKMHKE